MSMYPDPGAIVTSILQFVFIFAGIMALVFFIFEAIGIFVIAKRKEIPNAWLAFVPIASTYMFGKISQTPDKKRYVHIYLPLLEAAFVGIYLYFWLGWFMPLMQNVMSFDLSAESALAFSLNITLISWLIVLVGILYEVFVLIALYRIFKQLTPNNATVFLVLSIFFSFLMPFFLFAIRNKPINNEPVPQPAYAPYGQQPYGQPPQYGQQPYQQPYEQQHYQQQPYTPQETNNTYDEPQNRP